MMRVRVTSALHPTVAGLKARRDPAAVVASPRHREQWTSNRAGVVEAAHWSTRLRCRAGRSALRQDAIGHLAAPLMGGCSLRFDVAVVRHCEPRPRVGGEVRNVRLMRSAYIDGSRHDTALSRRCDEYHCKTPNIAADGRGAVGLSADSGSDTTEPRASCKWNLPRKQCSAAGRACDGGAR